MSLHLTPISWEDLREFVAHYHRHHRPPQGWKFGVGVATDEGLLVGVASVGRPVSRVIQSEGLTLEVTRTCTTGYPNANSMLYGAVARAAFALGYDRLITYTQASESGSSLIASGYRVLAQRPRRSGWDTPSRARQSLGTELIPRLLWEKTK